MALDTRGFDYSGLVTGVAAAIHDDTTARATGGLDWAGLGGVLVLVLFAIMLVHRSDAGAPDLESRHTLLTAVADTMALSGDGWGQALDVSFGVILPDQRERQVHVLGQKRFQRRSDRSFRRSQHHSPVR